MSKLKKLYYKITKQDTMEHKLERGEVTYEQAMEFAIVNFARAAFGYWDVQNFMKKEVKDYNLEVPKILKAIEDVENNRNPENRKTDLLYLKMFSETLRNNIEYKKMSNITVFSTAIMSIEGFVTFSEIAGIPFSRESGRKSIIEKCVSPEIQKKVEEKIHARLTEAKYYPSKGEMMFFYEAAWMFKEFASEVDNVNEVKCFNEKGLLINKYGDLVEHDVFKDYIDVDYKGIV